MNLRRLNWMFLFYLPLAGGIMLCLALLMQIIVSLEFEASQRQSKTPVLKFGNCPYVCDYAEGIFIE